MLTYAADGLTYADVCRCAGWLRINNVPYRDAGTCFTHIYTDDSSDDQLVQDVLDGMKETTSTIFFFWNEGDYSTIFFLCCN